MAIAGSLEAILFTCRIIVIFSQNEQLVEYLTYTFLGATLIKVLVDYSVLIMFAYFAFELFQIKKRNMIDGMELKQRLTVVLAILLFILNLFFVTCIFFNRSVLYWKDRERSREFVIYQDLQSHIIFRFIEYSNAMSFLYMFISITHYQRNKMSDKVTFSQLVEDGNPVMPLIQDRKEPIVSLEDSNQREEDMHFTDHDEPSSYE